MSLVSANKTETNHYELEVKVEKEQFEEALTKAFKKNAPKMTVPGFRKGKAPRHLIEKLYGESVFFEDAVNMSYPDAYAQAIEAAGITPVAEAQVEITEISKDGYTFKANVVVKPEDVEVENYKGIEATKDLHKVTEEEVNEAIERLRERNARIITVEDRAAENGDSAMIDFEGFVDGKAFEGGKGENYPLTLGSGQFIPGFEEQIVGHNMGDELDVNVTFPEEYHAKELAGKEAVFKCKLHELRSRELPELDDEFVKDVSEFDTLDELKKDTEKKLQEQSDKAAQDDLENKLIDTVIENLKAEIPEEMYENSINNMVGDFEYRLQMQGMDINTYLQYTGMEMESFRKTFREQAERQVKIRLALEKIAENEKLEASEEEVEAEYAKLAEQYGLEADKVKTFIPVEDLKKDVVVNKAIDFVKDNAKVKETVDGKKKTTRRTTKKKAEAEETAEQK